MLTPPRRVTVMPILALTSAVSDLFGPFCHTKRGCFRTHPECSSTTERYIAYYILKMPPFDSQDIRDSMHMKYMGGCKTTFCWITLFVKLSPKCQYLMLHISFFCWFDLHQILSEGAYFSQLAVYKIWGRNIENCAQRSRNNENSARRGQRGKEGSNTVPSLKSTIIFEPRNETKGAKTRMWRTQTLRKTRARDTFEARAEHL